jgi:hypothetical protein
MQGLEGVCVEQPKLHGKPIIPTVRCSFPFGPTRYREVVRARPSNVIEREIV